MSTPNQNIKEDYGINHLPTATLECDEPKPGYMVNVEPRGMVRHDPLYGIIDIPGVGEVRHYTPPTKEDGEAKATEEKPGYMVHVEPHGMVRHDPQYGIIDVPGVGEVRHYTPPGQEKKE